MLRKIALVLSILLASASTGHAMIVYDPSRAADFIDQFKRMKEQLDAAKDQLAQAKQMYESVTGNRNFGELFNDRKIEDLLPKDMQGFYDDLTKNGISGSVDDILKSEKLTGSVEDMSKAIDERQRQSAAAQKALGLKAYDAAQQRLNRIEDLRKEIAKTGDQKAIGELQARLQVEQAAIQSETNKLQILQQMQFNEDKLIEMQRQELNRKIFNKNNSEMPKIK